MQWEEVYAELLNKIRWSISTTTADRGAISCSFQEAQSVAGVCAGDVLHLLKLKAATPGFTWGRDEVRVIMNQPEESLNGKQPKVLTKS
jgi:hypothetical protein